MNKFMTCTGLACVFLIFSCDDGVNSPAGFSLPEGDVDAGRQVFINNSCLSCHSVVGLKDDHIERELSPPIKLGSTSAIVTTYAQLVTSIINPSHRISRNARWATSDENGVSKMRNYNDKLTVNELIDLVAFLQAQYKVKPMRITPFRNYEILLSKPTDAQ